MGRVLLESAVANLRKTKLALDDPKGVLNLGADAGLAFFNLVGDGVQWIFKVQGFALSRAHGHMLSDICSGIRALFNALVAGITESDTFLTVQQRVGLGNVADMP